MTVEEAIFKYLLAKSKGYTLSMKYFRNRMSKEDYRDFRFQRNMKLQMRGGIKNV